MIQTLIKAAPDILRDLAGLVGAGLVAFGAGEIYRPAGFIVAGALLLVSDQPMIPEGVKTEASDRKITENFVNRHIEIGVEALKLIRRDGKSVKHLRFDE